MVKIQLVESNEGYLDVAESTAVLLNISVSDVRDLTKKQGTYSQSIKLTGSKNNAIKLNNYFDVNVVSGTFDVSKKQKVILLQNGVPIEGELILQLKEVEILDKVVQSYTVEVKDSLVDLFTIISNRFLDELDFTEDNHIFSAQKVIDSFLVDYTQQSYKFHLTSNLNNEYNLEQFKPSIFAISYIDKIISNAGYSWEWDGLDDAETKFDKWIIPFNGDTGKLTEENLDILEVLASSSGQNDYDLGHTQSAIIGQTQPIIIDNEEKDLKSVYNPITFDYTNNYLLELSNSLKYEIKIDYDLILENTTGGTVQLNGGTGEYRLLLVILKNGLGSSTYYPKSGFAYSNTIPSLTSFPIGETIIDSVSSSGSVAINNLDIGDVTNIGLAIEQNAITNYTNNAINFKVRIKSIEVRIVPVINNIGLSHPIFMNNYIPKKIKQRDILKAFILMNNLWIDKERSIGNRIVFVKRDKYLDEGQIVNWEKQLDEGKVINIKFLSELKKKKEILTYKKDKDELNEAYFDATNEIYGQVEYTYDSEFVRGDEVKEIVFSPTPLHTTSFGAVVPAIDGVSPKNNIRILIDGGVLPCEDYTIKESSSSTVTISTGYPYVGHFDNPHKPTLDINFSVADYYFYNSIDVLTNNNLFNLNWRRYMNSINKGRLFTAWFNLSEFDIQKHRPNTKYWVEGKYWHVNKIIAYNANKRQLTKVELFPVDTEVKIPFKSKRPITTTGGGSLGDLIIKPVLEWIRKVSKSQSEILDLSSIDILGRGNVSSKGVTNALIIGNNLTAERNGVTAEFYSFGNGVYIDSTGFKGTGVNIISAGKDEVLGEFSDVVINLVTAGKDAVRGLGSTTNINKITAE